LPFVQAGERGEGVCCGASRERVSMGKMNRPRIRLLSGGERKGLLCPAIREKKSPGKEKKTK